MGSLILHLTKFLAVIVLRDRQDEVEKVCEKEGKTQRSRSDGDWVKFLTKLPLERELGTVLFTVFIVICNFKNINITMVYYLLRPGYKCNIWHLCLVYFKVYAVHIFHYTGTLVWNSDAI